MLIDETHRSSGGSTPQRGDEITIVQLESITSSAADLAGRFELQPLLERILTNAISLLGCTSGSICLVNESEGTYTKRVDLGVGCQEGQTFSLDQGVTGEVVRSRDVVILDSYSAIGAGHISADDPRWHSAVLGVPIQWGDRIIGSCVIFSSDRDRLFTTTDAHLAGLFASQAAIALANAELHAKATKRESEAAVALERERAVRDVHETVGRTLTAVIDRLDEVDGMLDPASPARPLLRKAKLESVEARAEARRTALGIGPASIEGRSLVEALESELEWVRHAGSVDAQLTVMGTPRQLPPLVEHQAFRIAQEALSNVVSHARATTVRVGIGYSAKALSLRVEDDGRGFDVPQTRSMEGSLARGYLGLHGMSSRTLHLGGEFRVESVEGWGTRINAVLPDRMDAADGTAVPSWKVLVSNAQPLVAAGIVRLIGLHEPSMQVAVDASNPVELLQSIEQLAPDVLVVDLDLLHEHMSEITARLEAANPHAAIVVYAENPTLEQIRMSKQLGVRGYINHSSTPETVVRSIVAAGQGQALIDGDMFERLLESRSSDGGRERLTARELEVKELVCTGMADKQIATALHISVKTVEKHVGSLLRKTGATNRTMLTRMEDERVSL